MTKTFEFINLHTKETRIVGGLRSLKHAWAIAEDFTAMNGWCRMDLIIKAKK